MIKKVHPYEGKIEIHNLVFPEVEQDPDKIGDLGKMEFDEYNACGAIIHGIGKVILRKKFYKGECDTISAFRK